MQIKQLRLKEQGDFWSGRVNCIAVVRPLLEIRLG